MTALLVAVGLLCWPVRPRLPTPGVASRSSGSSAGLLVVCRRLSPVIGVGSVVFAAVASGSVMVGLAGVLIVPTCWFLVRNTLRSRAERHVSTATMEAVRGLGRELNAGGDLVVAVQSILPTAPVSVSPLLLRLATAARFEASSSRPPPADPVELSLLAALRMSRQFGIPLANMMFRIADGISDQLAAADERATAVAGARLSGYLLAGLPAVGVLLGMGMGANPLPVLFGGGVGSLLLIAGVALSCAGLLWSARIAR